MKQRCPLWMTILIVVCCLPVFSLPALLSNANNAGEEVKIFTWLYPAYVVTAGVCAWICYPSRKAVTWILLVLMLLTHAAMWLLAM